MTFDGMICAVCRVPCGYNWTIYKGTLMHPRCIENYERMKNDAAESGKSEQ